VRVVLDTNVVASALLWGGTPERLIELAGEGSLELFTSQALLARADAIVSGDADLRALGTYQEIPILTPADCLRRIGG
jgi:predicted nucleic acid-binding protein